MRSEKNAESKGYGFIEYVNKDIAMQAKCALDGRELRDTTLVCDWLDPGHVTFASLHSSCLYVDCLPKDYRDMGEFRRIFSKVANPPYCQIAMKQGAIQDWGLIEFKNGEDAEETRNLLNGSKLKAHPIRVSYYIPGVRAINIYMKLINDCSMKKRGALLPEPPTNKVFTQLRNLTKHNPAFAKSLQNIILTQIQNLQQRGGISPPNCPGLPHQGPVIKGGRVLGPPPNILHHLPPFVQAPLQMPPPPPNSPPEVGGGPQQAPLNSNAQAALVILLAAQLQQQQEQQLANPQPNQNGVSINGVAGVLSNPQILNLLQTLVTQGDPNNPSKSSTEPPRNGYHSQTPVSSTSSSTSTSPLPSPPNSANNLLSNNLKNNFRNGYFKNGASKLPKGPLLPTPVSSSQNGYEENSSLDLENGVTPILNDLIRPPNVKETPKEGINSSIANLLSNPQILQQLLGSLTPENPQIPVPPHLMPPTLANLPPGMVATPHSLANSLHGPPPAIIGSPPLYHSPSQATDPGVMSFLFRAPDGTPRHPEAAFLSPVEQAPGLHPPFLLAPPRLAGPPQPSQAYIGGPAVFTTQANPQALSRLYSPIYLTRTMASQQPPIGLPYHPQFGGYSTPVGQKRKSSHFLPSPEPSPESGYIGQHSQGIGGHYQDSYKKKKKH